MLKQQKKPNILFIMSDQLSASAIGCLGNAIVKTPNIDQLASRGTLFSNCHCVSPICGPSRWSMMTGQYVHNHKGWDNGACLSSEEPTFAHALTFAGYETVICSRMHFHGPDQYHGFEKRLATEHNNPILYGSEGFGMENCKTPEFSNLKEMEYRDHYPVNTSSRAMHDDYVLDKAIEYLKSKSWKNRPFMMTASFLAPHPVIKRRKEYEAIFQEYVNMDLGASELTEVEFQKLHPHIKRLISSGKPKAAIYSERENHLLRAEYYSRISYFDQQIGKLINTLEEEKLSENTAIVFTSDHGECMGQFGYWGKQSFYDNVVKVPLIISLPQSFRETEYKENSVRDELVSLVDIFPTLVDLGNAPVPNYTLDGQNLMPLVQNKEVKVKDVVFSEYYGIYAKNAMFMVRKGNFKFNYYVNECSELFDISKEGKESTNLIDKPAYAKIKMDMEGLLRNICNPENLQNEYLRSHYKRSYITNSVATSIQTKERTKNEIRDYRKQWNEPTWDDNKEQSRHEKHLM